jgi:hypothetical protein
MNLVVGNKITEPLKKKTWGMQYLKEFDSVE